MLRAKICPVTVALAEEIYNTALTSHGLLNENERGVDNKMRVWWIQNEAVIGFLNAFFCLVRIDQNGSK